MHRHDWMPGVLSLALGILVCAPESGRSNGGMTNVSQTNAATQAPQSSAKAKLHLQKGNALLAREDLNGAIREFHVAVRYDPNDAAARMALGNALRRKGERDQAISKLREAVWVDPNSWQNHSVLGLMLLEKGDLDGAMTEYRTALPVHPDFVPALYYQGLALEKKGAMVNARNSLQLACTLDQWDEPAFLEKCKQLPGKR